MKEIQLSNTFNCALVDDEDYPLLNRFNWTEIQPDKIKYAITKFKDQVIRMHELILPGYPTVDHRDHNGLNNQKENLRGASYFQQMSNRRKFDKECSSKYKGVDLVKTGRYEGNYRARISVKNKRLELGYFAKEEDAAKAYDEAALEHFGEFAYLNFPQEPEKGGSIG